MRVAFNVPLNGVSFGQVATALLREARASSIDPLIFNIGDSVDLSTQGADKDFNEWINNLLLRAPSEHDRNDPTFKIWHLRGSLESFSKEQTVLSFYELDSPTEPELNMVRNNRTIFSSEHTVEVFSSMGASSHYVPLAFDHHNFKRKDKKYFVDDRIVFNLCGKFEKRKHHPKILNAWAKKYGNNNKYFLQCALYNGFLSNEDNHKCIANSLEGKKYSNIQILHPMARNSMYNDFLNSANIIIGMSGGEGWGLPEFHSVALGKHGVILDAHAYKSWANTDNAVMVESSGKIDAADGVFFKQGELFNQGQLFDWDEDDFLDGCEEAIKRHEANPVNEAGLKLQEKFTYAKTLEGILKVME